MENQHQKITGYRDLTQEEIDLMNEGKALSEAVGAYVHRLEKAAYSMNVEGTPIRTGVDQRWLSIGRTHLQQGFMAVIRSIAKPTTF